MHEANGTIPQPAEASVEPNTQVRVWPGQEPSHPRSVRLQPVGWGANSQLSLRGPGELSAAA